ncbi:hypothetical protein M422DRAFT_258998 [Sphaerobolus stellatus SS14]|uniref:Uncharacterized protein n=1 Tax=Sphaerobolus stellatus (strain SS14) TaxID=990650 RepID=A0A0C9VA08_SPHS4|nr:hypothetical protein M422DRAFT_258998 [Sphaerobolus stellatus SS14]
MDAEFHRIDMKHGNCLMRATPSGEPLSPTSPTSGQFLIQSISGLTTSLSCPSMDFLASMDDNTPIYSVTFCQCSISSMLLGSWTVILHDATRRRSDISDQGEVVQPVPTSPDNSRSLPDHPGLVGTGWYWELVVDRYGSAIGRPLGRTRQSTMTPDSIESQNKPTMNSNEILKCMNDLSNQHSRYQFILF